MRQAVRTYRFWLLQLVLAASWIAIWHLGRVLEQTAHASLWFPPAALTFALFLAQGRTALVPVVAGAVVTTFHSAALHGDDRGALSVLVTGLAFATAHGLAYGLGAWIFRRYGGRDRLGTPASVVRFLLVATLSSLLAAVAGIRSLTLTGAQVEGGLAGNLVPWWIGDLVAVVTLAPFFLLVVDSATRRLRLPSSGWSDSLERLGPRHMPMNGFLAKLVLSVGLAAALGAAAAVTDFGVPVALIAYVLIVPLMWIAHTEGGARTIVAVAVVATVVVLVSRQLGLAEEAFSYQAAMMAIAGTSLFNLTVPRLYSDNERLRHLVTFDQLTGARNRAVFLEAGQEALHRSRRHQTPVSLVLFDIDGFKSINDTFGHAAGDKVLAQVGQLIRQGLRSMDRFGRIGGEEFALLLLQTEQAPALALAERLRSALEAAAWGPDLAERKVTASFGVVTIGGEETFGDALHRADSALYEAKAAGRNRVRAG